MPLPRRFSEVHAAAPRRVASGSHPGAEGWADGGAPIFATRAYEGDTAWDRVEESVARALPSRSTEDETSEDASPNEVASREPSDASREPPSDASGEPPLVASREPSVASREPSDAPTNNARARRELLRWARLLRVEERQQAIDVRRYDAHFATLTRVAVDDDDAFPSLRNASSASANLSAPFRDAASRDHRALGDSLSGAVRAFVRDPFDASGDEDEGDDGAAFGGRLPERASDVATAERRAEERRRVFPGRANDHASEHEPNAAGRSVDGGYYSSASLRRTFADLYALKVPGLAEGFPPVAPLDVLKLRVADFRLPADEEAGPGPGSPKGKGKGPRWFEGKEICATVARTIPRLETALVAMPTHASRPRGWGRGAVETFTCHVRFAVDHAWFRAQRLAVLGAALNPVAIRALGDSIPGGEEEKQPQPRETTDHDHRGPPPEAFLTADLNERHSERSSRTSSRAPPA